MYQFQDLIRSHGRNERLQSANITLNECREAISVGLQFENNPPYRLENIKEILANYYAKISLIELMNGNIENCKNALRSGKSKSKSNLDLKSIDALYFTAIGELDEAIQIVNEIGNEKNKLFTSYRSKFFFDLNTMAENEIAKAKVEEIRKMLK